MSKFWHNYVRDNHKDFPSWPHPNIQSISLQVGGVLLVTSSTVDISSSHFESNAAKVGGAIFSHVYCMDCEGYLI